MAATQQTALGSVKQHCAEAFCTPQGLANTVLGKILPCVSTAHSAVVASNACVTMSAELGAGNCLAAISPCATGCFLMTTACASIALIVDQRKDPPGLKELLWDRKTSLLSDRQKQETFAVNQFRPNDDGEWIMAQNIQSGIIVSQPSLIAQGADKLTACVAPITSRLGCAQPCVEKTILCVPRFSSLVGGLLQSVQGMRDCLLGCDILAGVVTLDPSRIANGTVSCLSGVCNLSLGMREMRVGKELQLHGAHQIYYLSNQGVQIAKRNEYGHISPRSADGNAITFGNEKFAQLIKNMVASDNGDDQECLKKLAALPDSAIHEIAALAKNNAQLKTMVNGFIQTMVNGFIQTMITSQPRESKNHTD